jgi:hypothetical protein
LVTPSLTNVADLKAFIARMQNLLKLGGSLMLATQNREVPERNHRIPPPARDQLHRRVDAEELNQLLRSYFDVLKLYSVTPQADHELMRITASRKANAAIRVLVGTRPIFPRVHRAGLDTDGSGPKVLPMR